MVRRDIRQRCADALRDIEVPAPFDAEALCEAVARRRGRPLRLVPKPVATGPCGLWIAFESVDFVFYEHGTSRLHQNHIIAHEVGHLLCEHENSAVGDVGLLRELFPHLSPSLISSVMGRTRYSAVEEQEAELIATLVLERSTAQVPAPQTADAVVIHRLAAALGGQAH
jgi:hypothetical protein